MIKLLKQSRFFILVVFCLQMNSVSAQTDIDAIMMEKNAFCVGPMYSYSSWKNYWEGTLKRDNLNLGKVSTQMFGLMGNLWNDRKIKSFLQCSVCNNKSFRWNTAWYERRAGP